MNFLSKLANKKLKNVSSLCMIQVLDGYLQLKSVAFVFDFC